MDPLLMLIVSPLLRDVHSPVGMSPFLKPRLE